MSSSAGEGGGLIKVTRPGKKNEAEFGKLKNPKLSKIKNARTIRLTSNPTPKTADKGIG